MSTVPRPRAVFERLPAYRAGRPAPDDAHKLSSNENPFPPLPNVLSAATRELGRMNRYPDAGMGRLYAAIAAHLGVEEERLAAGTGSVGALFTLLSAYCDPGDEVVYAWRSFEAYPIGIELAGATPVPVPLRPDATHDLPAMAAAVTGRTRVVLVCTPNNPTGPVVARRELDAFLAGVPSSVLVVIDEAYVEFVRDLDAASGLDSLARHDNVVVLRTFSKAYGLAGLRVGYLVAHPEVAAVVRTATPPFAVSDLAIAAVAASLDELDELDERVEAVVAERDAMAATLRAGGWAIPESHTNFLWLPLGDDAVTFAEHAWPVSVRPFAGEGVRVTLGDPAVNREFLDRIEGWHRAIE
ncbi:histidinol-phosphate transaminase [Aeromicrobium sp. YIM 150415]|uniref:histidinol-phosphate transaminase n=1 Tax=Aeromicrobium sp. YIM 150415 TaxID=2803912 RepID=UPI001965C4AB|nr:histidinol-phosphate transaminase [Aeromicrobium sp. YIM 150415]MBM9462453.1 histidinol-phosphate transaminase [Aeromicrobium sp. YIM 150415]